MFTKPGSVHFALFLLLTCGVSGIVAPRYDGLRHNGHKMALTVPATADRWMPTTASSQEQNPDQDPYALEPDEASYRNLCGTVKTDRKAQKVVITTDSPNPAVEQLLRNRERKEGIPGEDMPPRRLHYRFNLKTDGGEALIVEYADPTYCGSGGCTYLILEKSSAGTYRIRQRLSPIRSIRIARTVTAGWHDLVVEMAGNPTAVTECYLAQYNPQRGRYVFVRRPKDVTTWVFPAEKPAR